MINVIERHKEDMTLIFATVYTLSKRSGGELNFDSREKFNPKNVKGKLRKYKNSLGKLDIPSRWLVI